MPLRPVGADRLALALDAAQGADEHRADQEADQQCGEACCTRAEGDVAEQVEQNKVFREWTGEAVEHQRPPAGCRNAWMMVFMRLPRLPLTSTASSARKAASTLGARLAASA